MNYFLRQLRGRGKRVLYQGAGFAPIAPGVQQSSKLSQLYSGNDLVAFVQNLFVFALTIGAIIAVVRLVIAGYHYMGSSNMWSSKMKAVSIFQDVVFGILLLLGTWLILNQINPEILNLDILAPIKGNPVNQALLKTGKAAQTCLGAPQGGAATTPVAGCTYVDPCTGVCLVYN